MSDKIEKLNPPLSAVDTAGVHTEKFSREAVQSQKDLIKPPGETSAPASENKFLPARRGTPGQGFGRTDFCVTIRTSVAGLWFKCASWTARHAARYG